MEIEESTRGQSRSERWKTEREKRITASNFGTICRARDQTGCIRNLLYPPNIGMCKAVQHGWKYERIALKHFEEKTRVKTAPCGLFVCKSSPMIAATPDAIIDDDTILEIKCPYSAWDRKIDETVLPYLTKTDNGYELKVQHPYFYQCQGQMLCSGRHLCKFIVYTSKDFISIDVPRNETFIREMLDKLTDFYRTLFKEALLNKYLFNEENKFFN